MILIDNTVLSNFALIHHPEALQQAFCEDIGTMEQVFHELERGVRHCSMKIPSTVVVFSDKFLKKVKNCVRYDVFFPIDTMGKALRT